MIFFVFILILFWCQFTGSNIDFVLGIIFYAKLWRTDMIVLNIVNKSSVNNLKALIFKKYFLKSLFYIRNGNNFL